MPTWKEFIMDDEQAVQSILSEIYPGINISLCLFHLNKNILRTISKHHMSNYFRKCSNDIEMWTYDKIRNILTLPFLPKRAVEEEFLKIENKIISTLKEYVSPRDLEVFEIILSTLKKNYFANKSKIEKFSKLEKVKELQIIWRGTMQSSTKASCSTEIQI